MTRNNYIGALEVLGIGWCQGATTSLMPRHLVRDWGAR